MYGFRVEHRDRLLQPLHRAHDQRAVRPGAAFRNIEAVAARLRARAPESRNALSGRTNAPPVALRVARDVLPDALYQHAHGREYSSLHNDAFSRRRNDALSSCCCWRPCLFAASAQGWKPTKDVEFVIPFAVGGGADLMARVIHKIITEEKLVPVPVALVNKPGGGGAAGIGYVAASRKADPHTLVLINGTTQITPILNPNGEDADRSAAGDERDARRLRVLRARRRAVEDRRRFRRRTPSPSRRRPTTSPPAAPPT